MKKAMKKATKKATKKAKAKANGVILADFRPCWTTYALEWSVPTSTGPLHCHWVTLLVPLPPMVWALFSVSRTKPTRRRRERRRRKRRMEALSYHSSRSSRPHAEERRQAWQTKRVCTTPTDKGIKMTPATHSLAVAVTVVACCSVVSSPYHRLKAPEFASMSTAGGMLE
jgi:hypothetical protein